MDTLLLEIKSNDGVVGSVVMRKDGSERARDLPTVFHAAKLQSFANHIYRLALLKHDEGEFLGMEFSFQEAMVVARFISNDYLLLTFCMPGVDVQMIHLQHKVLLPEFQDIVAGKKAAQPAPAVTTPPPPSPHKDAARKHHMVFRGATYEE